MVTLYREDIKLKVQVWTKIGRKHRNAPCDSNEIDFIDGGTKEDETDTHVIASKKESLLSNEEASDNEDPLTNEHNFDHSFEWILHIYKIL